MCPPLNMFCKWSSHVFFSSMAKLLMPNAASLQGCFAQAECVERTAVRENTCSTNTLGKCDLVGGGGISSCTRGRGNGGLH